MEPNTTVSTVSRSLRAAIKIGENYWPVESTLTLPVGATDGEIAAALALSARMYAAHQAAFAQEVPSLMALPGIAVPSAPAAESEQPMSAKQQAYIDYLLRELTWDEDRLAELAAEHALTLSTLTRRDASVLIDYLKQIRDGDLPAPQREIPTPVPLRRIGPRTSPAAPATERATPRQLQALERLAAERGIDIATELAAHAGGRTLAELSLDEAGALLAAWHQRPRSAVPRRAA